MNGTSSTSTILSAFAAALILFTGCGEPSASGTDAGTPPEPIDSGTPDAGTNDPPACASAEAPCSITWEENAPYPTPVDHHTAFAHASSDGTWVYVVGGVQATFGNPSDVFAAVRRAKVFADGSLRAWEPLGDLPAPLGFHAMAVTDRRVYLVAGITRDGTTLRTHRATLVGDLDEGGQLTWRTGPELPESFLHPSAQVLGARLYLVGGSGSQHDPKDKVYVAELDGSGMIGAWSAAPRLPEPRSHHLTVRRDERIYVVGGFRADHTPIADVLRSVHDEEGALTGWEVVGTMQDAPWTAAGFVHGDWLYVIGGGEGGPGEESYVGRVRRALFDANGQIPNGFEDVASPLPAVRAHVHHTPVVDGRIYSIGGRDESFTSLEHVYVGELHAD